MGIRLGKTLSSDAFHGDHICPVYHGQMRWTLLDAAVVRIESDLEDPSRTGPTDSDHRLYGKLSSNIGSRGTYLSIGIGSHFNLSSLLRHPDHSGVRLESQVAAILPNNPTK